MGQGGEDAPKGPASKALKPSEVTKLPRGTPVRSLALPHDYGRFRIIPPQTAPEYCTDPRGRSRVKQVTKVLPPMDTAVPQGTLAGPEGDIVVVRSLDELRGHALFIQPSYMPPGWQLGGAEAFSITWDDGSHQDASFSLYYQQPGHFDIGIRRFVIPADCQLNLVDIGRARGFQHALTLSEIRGVPVVIQHQAPGEKIQATLQVTFIIGDTVTMVEGVAIDLDELLKIADALIAQAWGIRP